MNQIYKYSLESVQEADKSGELFQWAQDYLRGEGRNSGLADHLVEEKLATIIFKKFPLKKLKRIMGPEKGMNFVKDQEVWIRELTN